MTKLIRQLVGSAYLPVKKSERPQFGNFGKLIGANRHGVKKTVQSVQGGYSRIGYFINVMNGPPK